MQWFANKNNISICGAILLSVFTFCSYAQSPEQLFSDGMAAFANNDHLSARDYFLQARAMGLDNAKLAYNLGVTNYKLGFYPSAYDAFKKATNDNKLATLAYYNLGLTSYQLDNIEQASLWFNASLNATDNSQLQRLSQLMLDKINHLPVIKTKTATRHITDDYSTNTWAQKNRYINSTWRAMLRSDVGVDDNVALYRRFQTNDLNSGSDQFGTIHLVLRGEILPKLNIELSTYFLNYSTKNQYDYAALSFANHYSQPFKKMTGNDITGYLGSNFEKRTLGSTDFQQVVNLFFGIKHVFEMGQLVELRYAFERIMSQHQKFDHLAGKRQEMEARWQIGLHDKKLLLFYIYETNNRQDFTVLTETKQTLFESYSPQRHTLGTIGSLDINGRWSGEVFTDVSLSQYKDANFIAGDHQVHNLELLYRTGIRFSRQIGKNVRVLGEYAFDNNTARLSKYIYQNNRYTMGLRWKY